MISRANTVTVLAPTNAGISENISQEGLETLVLPENRAALRQLLLHHFVPNSVSLFAWNGAATSSTGSAIVLSMDPHYFYAGSVPVKDINALTTRNVVVHSMGGVIVPAPLVTSMLRLRPHTRSSPAAAAIPAGSSWQSRRMAPEKQSMVAVQRENDIAATVSETTAERKTMSATGEKAFV
ncbi:unnamed protein product [Closterium sp. NIES-53]